MKLSALRVSDGDCAHTWPTIKLAGRANRLEHCSPSFHLLRHHQAMSLCKKVEVMASHGRVSFDYVISTPKETSAKTIDSALPTVLLLHTVFFGKEVFHRTLPSEPP